MVSHRPPSPADPMQSPSRMLFICSMFCHCICLRLRKLRFQCATGPRPPRRLALGPNPGQLLSVSQVWYEGVTLGASFTCPAMQQLPSPSQGNSIGDTTSHSPGHGARQGLNVPETQTEPPESFGVVQLSQILGTRSSVRLDSWASVS